MSKQTFIKGAIILIIAGMISRLLGFVNRIVMARLLGEDGIGIYMLSLPALFLMITLSQIGIPVAVSKLVAEANVVNDQKRIRLILLISFSITICLSILLSALFVVAVPFVTTYLITDSRTFIPMLVMTPIILIIAISSVIRGYFQGMQNMVPQATSQVIEQVFRILLVVIFVKQLLPYGIEWAAAGAMFSVVLGELLSLCYMLLCFKKYKHISIFTSLRKPIQKCKETFVNILQIALPTAGTRMIGSTTYFLEPILVSQSLLIAGYTIAESTKLYGQLTGYVLPLLLLPTFITHSISVALIPSISESNSLNHQETIRFRLTQALRISFASGGLATIVFMLLAASILEVMYGSQSGATFLTFMAPFFLLLYFQAPLQATLQALNFAKQAMVNSLVGALVKLATLWILATNPSFGMDGVMLSLLIGIITVTLLHFISLYKLIHYTFPLMLFVRMLLVLGITYTTGFNLKIFFTDGSILSIISIILILSIVYLFLLFCFKLIQKDEFRHFRLSNKG
ncbi:stage V sporulation protein B [Halalkalibacillus halophilus]|uniref:stage V sporulation protein B n=1 Tax=Halalkalibacillus halophilus TaxID=392827 RepID=UPI000400AAD0|nr:stage V sporulation protein B [Halalkalibacillus halophilus]